MAARGEPALVVFQFSIGDARLVWRRIRRVAQHHRFQFSIGDAAIEYSTEKRWSVSCFNSLLEMRWTSLARADTQLSSFNSLLEMHLDWLASTWRAEHLNVSILYWRCVEIRVVETPYCEEVGFNSLLEMQSA